MSSDADRGATGGHGTRDADSAAGPSRPPGGAHALANVADGPDARVNDLVASVGLVDHHVHGIVRGPVDAARLAGMLVESDRPAAVAAAGYDTQVWHAVRRWCGPLLGLEPGAPIDGYLAARLALTNEEAAAALLPHAGVERLVVETGYRGDEITGPDELGALTGAPADRVVRIESVAERVAIAEPSAAGYADAFREALAAEAVGAVGTKTVLAYRSGFDVDLSRPSDAEVTASAGAWLREMGTTGRARVANPVLLAFGAWTAVDLGKPLQVHTGFGDPDLDLHRSDPLLLTDFLRATEGRCDVLLLHTYPFHRGAGYLAQMFPHVYLDVGLAINYAGAASPAIVAESLELAPFTKVLYSSDAWGAPELHLLGSVLFRRALARVVGGWVAAGDWTHADAARVVRLVAAENARRVYGLPTPG